MDQFTSDRIRQILTLSPAIIYVCRADGDFGATFVSDNITTYFGYASNECLENPGFWRENIHPDDYDRVFSVYDSFFEKGHHIHEYRFRKKDGNYTWVLDELRLVRDADGSPLEIVGSWLDISDRKTTEAALSKTEELFKTFFDINPIPTVISTDDGVIERVNSAFLKSSGFARDEVEGQNAQDLFWSSTADREKMLSSISNQGYIENLQCDFYNKDKESRTCLLSSNVIEIGNQRRILNTVVDISDQLAAEDIRLKSEQLFRTLFQISPVGYIVTSPEGMIHLANPAFISASGYTLEEIVGRTVFEVGFWKDPGMREVMLASIQKDGFIDDLEAVMYAKDNKAMTCLVSSRVINYFGETRILNVVVDITDQRAAEAAMRKLEKAKSDFISTVAHELRTPLIAIVGYCELLENSVEMKLTEEQKNEFLGVIQNNAEILNRLVDDLLDIGRIQIGRSLGIQPTHADLKSVAEKVVASFRIKSSLHEISIECYSDIPQSLYFDVGRITQVMHNLISNAIKYSPDGGIVKVTLLGKSNCVEVSVVDQGIGMNADQVEHIFDRFYRAEESAEAVGLGLGMNIVKQIIVDHSGDINIISSPGKGTAVTFKLPL